MRAGTILILLYGGVVLGSGQALLEFLGFSRFIVIIAMILWIGAVGIAAALFEVID